MTPLMAAAIKGQRDVVKVLLASGADVTAISVKVGGWEREGEGGGKERGRKGGGRGLIVHTNWPSLWRIPHT